MVLCKIVETLHRQVQGTHRYSIHIYDQNEVSLFLKSELAAPKKPFIQRSARVKKMSPSLVDIMLA